MDMQQRTVVVTGGASGIGKATAFLIVRAGRRVLIGDVDQVGGRAAEAEAQVQQLPIQYFPLDLTNKTSIDDFVATVHRQVEPVDGLVNGAGWGPNSAISRKPAGNVAPHHCRQSDGGRSAIFRCSTSPIFHGMVGGCHSPNHRCTERAHRLGAADLAAPAACPQSAAYKMIRAGVFGTTVNAYGDPMYTTRVLGVLTLLELRLLREGQRYVVAE